MNQVVDWIASAPFWINEMDLPAGYQCSSMFVLICVLTWWADPLCRVDRRRLAIRLCIYPFTPTFFETYPILNIREDGFLVNDKHPLFPGVIKCFLNESKHPQNHYWRCSSVTSVPPCYLPKFCLWQAEFGILEDFRWIPANSRHPSSPGPFDSKITSNKHITTFCWASAISKTLPTLFLKSEVKHLVPMHIFIPAVTHVHFSNSIGCAACLLKQEIVLQKNRGKCNNWAAFIRWVLEATSLLQTILKSSSN